MRSKGINPTEHVQVIYFPLKPQFVSVHACAWKGRQRQRRQTTSQEGSVRVRLVTHFRYGYVDDVQMIYSKERRGSGRGAYCVVFKRVLSSAAESHSGCLADVCGYWCTKMRAVRKHAGTEERTLCAPTRGMHSFGESVGCMFLLSVAALCCSN